MAGAAHEETLAAPVLDARPLRFGRPPTLNVTGSEAEYEPLARYMGEALERQVHLSVSANYEGSIKALEEGRLDLALLTPFAYISAKDRVPGLKLVASLIGEGTQRYCGYIVVAQEQPWRSVAELVGKRFAFVDRQSASGYLYPLARLRESGIVPERDFRSVVFAGSHPAVVEAILSGKVDAGAISSTTFQHMRASQISRRLVVVDKTDWIPFDAIVAHPSLAEDVVAKLRASLLAISVRTPEGRAILSGVTTTSGFVPPDDSIYDSVRRVADTLHLR